MPAAASTKLNRPVTFTSVNAHQLGNSIEVQWKVENETGMDVSQTVAPDKLKAYSTVGGAPMLDGDYTVFGKVIKGLEVIDKITDAEKDGANRPTKDIPMTVTVEELTEKAIKKRYGYDLP